MDQATMSIDERRVRMSELVERLATLGLSVNFTPHYVELIVAYMFEEDAEGYERFQEDWLDVCEGLLTEEMVQAAENENAMNKLRLGRKQEPQGPLTLVE